MQVRSVRFGPIYELIPHMIDYFRSKSFNVYYIVRFDCCFKRLGCPLLKVIAEKPLSSVAFRSCNYDFVFTVAGLAVAQSENPPLVVEPLKFVVELEFLAVALLVAVLEFEAVVAGSATASLLYSLGRLPVGFQL